MSYSVSNLFADMVGNVQQTKDGQLYNPDIPQPQVDYKKLKTLKDRSFSAFKLPVRSSRAYNNSYLRLPNNPLYKDPRKNNFSMDGAIDPNTIRQLQDQLGAKGITAQPAKLRTIVIIGANKKTTLLELAGTIFSFVNNLRASAKL